MSNTNSLIEERNSILSQAEAILNKAKSQKRYLTSRETFEVDQLMQKAENFNGTIERFNNLSQLASVVPEQGLGFSRFIRSLAGGGGHLDRAAEYAEFTLKDPHLAKALSASTMTSGGALVPEQYSAEIFTMLQARTAVRRFNPTIYPLRSGIWSSPRITNNAAAGYVDENGRILATQPIFGGVKLAAKKLAAIIPISNDLIRYSNPSADLIVRDQAVASISVTEDAHFIRSDGTANTPKGFRHWAPAANVFTANATANLANIQADLSKLEFALINSNVPMLQPGWLMAPRTEAYLKALRDDSGQKAFPEMSAGVRIFPEMATGQLMGFPYIATNSIPTNFGDNGDESEIYLVDFSEVVIGEVPNLIVNIARAGSYLDADGNAVSLFSNDMSAVRVIAEHDLGLKHAEAVAVLVSVKWANA